MDTGGDRGERDESGVGGGSGISRRHFVAGGLVSIGGLSMLVDEGTNALFSDSESTTGVIQADRLPALNYHIIDETRNTNAEYQVAYQVKWVTDFDRIEIDIENLTDGNISGESYTEDTEEGVVEYPLGGGSDGGAEQDTYRFTFAVFDGNDTKVIGDTVVEDEADGEDQSEGDFGDPDDTKIASVTVVDEMQTTNGDYTVEYELTNVQDDFQDVVVTFDNKSETGWGDATRTNESSPTGSVEYAHGGIGGDSYEITIEVRNTNGIAVDSHTITDESDGEDASWSA